jgi:predicted nucleic acid-binding protein
MRATERWVANTGTRGKKVSARAEKLLRSIGLMDLDLASVFRAGAVRPVELRSLDAIHLGTALDLADDLEAFVTYDTRLAAGARAAGLEVISPS